MINSQNYIANIGGKPLIIANKTNASGGNVTSSGQGLVLQANNSPNGTFILNSQGQQLKVQGNILTQVIARVYFYSMEIIIKNLTRVT